MHRNGESFIGFPVLNILCHKMCRLEDKFRTKLINTPYISKLRISTINSVEFTPIGEKKGDWNEHKNQFLLLAIFCREVGIVKFYFIYFSILL